MVLVLVLIMTIKKLVLVLEINIYTLVLVLGINIYRLVLVLGIKDFKHALGIQYLSKVLVGEIKILKELLDQEIGLRIHSAG